MRAQVSILKTTIWFSFFFFVKHFLGLFIRFDLQFITIKKSTVCLSSCRAFIRHLLYAPNFYFSIMRAVYWLPIEIVNTSYLEFTPFQAILFYSFIVQHVRLNKTFLVLHCNFEFHFFLSAFVYSTLMSGQRCPNDNQINDQIVIITGGNTGIGYEIAKALAGRGGRIILACRNMPAGEKAASVIKRELGCRCVVTHTQDANNTQFPVASINDKFFVEVRYLDLRSFDSVNRFARNIMAEFERVDILINNAGVIFEPSNATTTDGFEQHLQVNYLSHFLLSHLLLGHLKMSANGRIINVSAHAHAAAKMDFDDPLNVGTWAVKFHARDAFAHSKLAVILATRWLAKELKGELS